MKNSTKKKLITLFCLKILILSSTFYFGQKFKDFRSKLPANTTGKTFNHTIFDKLLKENVNKNGFVYYNQFKSKEKTLKQYLKQLNGLNINSLTLYDQIAVYINAYNAFTIQLILNNYPIQSIKNIPDNKRWDYKIWKVNGKKYSLNEIEHTILRGKYREPRIHFAVVCASKGCPILINRAYKGSSLESDLEYSMFRFLEVKQNFYYNSTTNKLMISKIFSWYKKDFESAYGSLEQFLYNTLKKMQKTKRKLYVKNKNGYKLENISNDLIKKVLQKKIKIGYTAYSWKLNGK